MASGAAVTAQDQSAQAPPTFRSGVQLVEVDVTVRDRDGRLVRDLTADDFVLTEDGLPQQIVSFRLVDIPIAMQPRRSDAPPIVSPDVTTNTTSGRVYVVLLDNPPGVPWSHVYLTQRTARRFVNEALAPDDLTAIIDLHSGSGSHPLTKDRSRLLAAIDRFGRGALGRVPLFGPEQRHDPVGPYETIQFLAERLGAVGSHRKAIVWIGGVVPFHHQYAASAVAYRDAVRAAERHNVAIYPVDPHGLTVTMGRGELERVSALRAAAEDTGGYAVVNTNNFTGGYRRIVEENSTYYVLGYYPAVERRDGRFHAIDVRTKRPGLSVRARKGYTAPTPEALAAARQPLPEGLTREAADALRSVVNVDRLGLEIFAAPFMGADRRGSVLLGLHIRGRDLALDGGRLEVTQLAIDPASEIHGAMRRAFPLELPPDRAANAAASGLRYFDRLDLGPGRHEIRLAVHQPGGAVGSVTTHVDVPDFSESRVTMSGVVLSSRRDAAIPVLLRDERAANALGAEPTVSRRFPTDDVATIWAEVYDARTQPASPLTMTMRVARRDGGSVLSRSSALMSQGDSAGVRTLEYRDRLDLAGLAPGEYVLDLDVSDQRGTRIETRRVPFSVAAF